MQALGVSARCFRLIGLTLGEIAIFRIESFSEAVG
jgi:hypothetical protein